MAETDEITFNDDHPENPYLYAPAIEMSACPGNEVVDRYGGSYSYEEIEGEARLMLELVARARERFGDG